MERESCGLAASERDVAPETAVVWCLRWLCKQMVPSWQNCNIINHHIARKCILWFDGIHSSNNTYICPASVMTDVNFEQC